MHKLNTILLFLALFAIPTPAQDTENWLSVINLCGDSVRHQIEVTVNAAITEVIITPSDPQSPALFWYPEATLVRRFWLSAESTYIYISAFYDGGNAAAFRFALVSDDCANTPIPPSEPMNECLGLSLEELIAQTAYTPHTAVFMVDAQEYSFGDYLSFLVPETAIWQWDLYMDNRHLLTFEQSEATPCQITAFYPQ